MEHPKVPTCGDCKTYMYDDDGERQTGRDGLPVLRYPGLPTPCSTCPRKHPDREAETTLTPANYRAYLNYLENRESFGQGMSEREASDPLARIVRRIIGETLRGHELGLQMQASAGVMQMVTGLLSSRR